MKSRFLTAWFTGLFSLVVSLPAFCSVTYDFAFKDLTLYADNSALADFNLTLTYDDYITSAGLAHLSTSHSTTLGYDINNAGTNGYLGQWGFDSDGTSTLTLNDYLYSDTSFLVQLANVTDFITAPGSFSGWIYGNAQGFFSGTASLTVTETPTSVPEPAPVILLLAGLAGLTARRLRRV